MDKSALIPHQDSSMSLNELESRAHFYDGPKPTKKMRWCAIGVFVSLMLLTLALTLVVFVGENQKPKGDRFSFDDIFDPDMKVKRTTVRWIDPDGTMTFLDDGDIYLQRLPSQTPELYVKGSDILDEDGKPLEFFDYWLSADEKFLLLGTQYEKVWRHSYNAVYYFYDVSAKKATLLTSEKTQYATWSPVGHSIAYVVGNDVYVLRDDLTNPIRVTSDGSLNVLNGVPAWVYEEEVFGTNYALWWSPEADKVAFLRSDETDVDIFYLTMYGKGAYPQQIPVKYPKPGFTNPTTELIIYDIDAALANPIDFAFGEESLIVQVAWIDNNSLAARLTNRVQNHSKLYRVETASLVATVVSQQKSTTGWVEYSELLLIPGTTQYIELIDYQGYNHIALYDYSNPTPIRMVTSGNWEVTQIAGFRADLRRAYYLSTEGDETERTLFSVDIDKGVSSRVNMTLENGFYSVSFSTGSGFYVLNYNGPNIPYQHIKSTSDPDMAIVLENNDELREKLSTYALPERMYIKAPIPANGDWKGDYEINCVMILPPDFVETEPRMYSVLHRVYGGPGSNLVQKTFTLDWHTYLASSEEYIISMCDGRGTGQRGNVFKHAVYKHLGEYEAFDQVEASRYIQDFRYTRIDNIIVWGWSYGGYMTSKILETGSGVFIGGIAVAPVSRWEYYDTVYTERFMLTPQENPNGYAKSAIHDFAKINGTEYLIVHGTADDNVHFQHALVLMDDLTQANVDFDTHIYTDNDHSINTGSNTQRDLYRRFTEFLMTKQERLY